MLLTNDWSRAAEARLREEVRIMQDAYGRSFDEARTLLEEFLHLRRDGAYPRQTFKVTLEKYGFLTEDAGRLAAQLDSFFDDFQKELTRILVIRDRMVEQAEKDSQPAA